MDYKTEFSRVGWWCESASLTLTDMYHAVGSWAVARALDADLILIPSPTRERIEQLEWLKFDWDEDAPNEHTAELTDTITLPPFANNISIQQLQQNGYLPSAIWSMIIHLLNPHYPDGLITKWETREQFRLDNIPPQIPELDWAMLDQLNKLALDKLPIETFIELATEQLEDAYGMEMNADWMSKLVQAVKPDLYRLDQIVDVAEWAFDPMPDLQDAGRVMFDSAETASILTHFLAEISTIVLLDEPTTVTILRGIANRFPNEPVDGIIKAGLTGSQPRTSTEQIASLLGKSRCLQRIAWMLKTQLR